MKKLNTVKHTGAAVAALLTLGLASTAQAQLQLTYETGPNMGQVYNGGFTIKLQGVDMGSLYNLPVGTSAGFGQGGTSASVAAGVTALDAIDVGATGSIGSEDSWGIARIEGIFADDSFNSRVWSPAGKNQELTIFFYGEQDYYVSQKDPQTFLTNGVNLRADFYLQSTTAPGYTPFNVALGAAGRTSFSQYTGITDGALVLSTVSTAGFLNAPGVNGGTAAEFATLFNDVSLIGEGSTYLSIVGGTDAAKYNTDSYVSAFLNTTADLKASFTTAPPSGAAAAAGWLVDFNDPIVGLTGSAVPEPSTYGLMGAAALLGIAAYRRRAMKRAQA